MVKDYGLITTGLSLLRWLPKLDAVKIPRTAIEKRSDVELPKVPNPRVDLLGETADGGVVHVELQSGNDATMPLRMAEYCLALFRLFGQFPLKVLLYVGGPPLRKVGRSTY